MLAAQLEEAAGAVVRTPAVAVDAAAAPGRRSERGLEHDVLVTSGSCVRGGPRASSAASRASSEWRRCSRAWRNLRPGKPVSFGVRGKTLVFGLPGNPVSSLVACALFVVPAIEALPGAADPGPHFEWGHLVGPVQRDSHRDVLLRALARMSEHGVSLEPVQGQESHMITRAAGANALARSFAAARGRSPGSPVEYLRL